MNGNLNFFLEKYLDSIKPRELSPNTLVGYRKDIKVFITFLQSMYPALNDVREIKEEMIFHYHEYLLNYSKKDGNKLSRRTFYNYLRLIRYWFNFLVKQNVLLVSPMRNFELEKLGYMLPKVILTEEEVKRMIDVPDIKTHVGIRNRAILEILYGSGIRKSELSGIKISDVDLLHSYIHIKGKGNKDRIVPMTKQARNYLKKYIQRVRPFYYIKGFGSDSLFLNKDGGDLHGYREYSVVRKSLMKAKIKKKASTHTLRHSCASHLITRGANIRYLQELLGHSNISSTQIYTNLMPIDLQTVYNKTHPRCVPGKLEEDED